MLNVSSNPADLLPQARIRLAALELFGQQGFDQTTIRQIATRAGVSPGLVIHHFGSKNDLRQACDDYAYRLFAEERVYLKGSGPMPTLERFMADHPDLQPVLAYLVQCLRGGGEGAERVYRLFCSLSDEMLTEAEQQGLLSLPEDRQAAIAVFAAWAAGLQMLGDLFARQLGGQHISDPDVMRRYAVVTTELLSRGLLSASFTDMLRSVIEPSDHKESNT
jgi:AcrR family transcriptional regulator